MATLLVLHFYIHILCVNWVLKCSSLLSSPPGYRWLTTPTPPSPVSPVGGCREKEFQCENGRCVPAGPLGVVCDGVNNCGDGSDEMYCGELFLSLLLLLTSCLSSHGCCNSHKPKMNIEIILTQCDHSSHTGTQPSPTTSSPRSCRAGQFSCPPPGGCIEAGQRCDGIPHCPRGEDETGCHPHNITTQSDRYHHYYHYF